MFNNVLHQGVRSQIMALLIKDDEMSFKMLKKNLSLSDGNLSSHLSKLEKEHYIQINKSIVDKRNITIVMVTNKGKIEFKLYIKQLQDFIESI